MAKYEATKGKAKYVLTNKTQADAFGASGWTVKEIEGKSKDPKKDGESKDGKDDE